MAVNTQKLLSGSGTLSTKTSRIAVSSGSKEKGGALVRSDRGALSRDILQMKTRVLKLQGVVESNRKENQKEQDVKRRNEEKEERKKREKKLEAKPGLKGIGLPNVVANLPGGSIVSAIKRYLGFTLLGWLVGKYNELGPKLEGFMKVAKPAFEGLVFATESILKGVYTFVETGYKAYDTINTGIKKLGGVGAEKTFNEFSGHLNKLLNGAIIASMLIISTAPRRPKGGPKGPTGAGVGGGTTKPATPKPRGYDAWARNFPQQAARDAARKPPTGAAAPKPPGGVKPGFGRFPVIGPLITFTIRTLVYKEAPQKAAAAAVGMGIGQAIGTFIGGLGAGALGLGTAGLGAIVAPLIVGAGSIIGGLVGEWIGAALYDAISGMFSKKTTGRANGGRVGSTGTTPRSSIKRSLPRRQRVMPQNTSPGKDVGGRKQIENFYGKETIEKIDRSGFRRKETRGQIVVKELEKISKDVKKLPVDWVASIGGAYVDMTLGQKPDPNLAGSIARSFGQFIEGAMNSQISATTAEITKAFVGMASGGIVPETKPGEVSKKVSDNIEKRLQEVFNKSSTIALKSIRSQSFFQDEIDKIEGAGGPGEPSGAGGGGGAGGTDIDKITLGTFSAEDIDALGRMIAAEAGNQPKLGKAGVLSVILNRYRLAKSGDRGYMPDGKNKNNVTLKDILYDAGQFAPIKDGRFDRTSSAAGKNALADAIAASGNDPKKFKETLIKELRLSETEAETVVRATAFSNPKTRSVKPFDTPEVSVGNHSFQESPYSRVGSFPGAISARIDMKPSQVEALATGFRTGLRTGPAGRIGAGTEYHIDGRFMHSVPLKDKIAMLDSMAAAHAQEGYAMEFSGGDIAGMRWNPGMSRKQKEEFARKVLASHHANRHPWQAFDYYIVKKSAKDRFDKSAEGANVMAPIIKDGTYEYQEGGGGGRYLIIKDKNGNEVMRILHGDLGVPSPKQLGKTFKMNELTEAQAQAQAKRQAAVGQRPAQTGQASITQALASKGAIPVTYGGQKFFFRVSPSGSVEAFKPKNFFSYQEPIDIGGTKNKGLRDAINAKVQSMYGKPQPGPASPGYGKQKGGATLSSSQPRSSISSLSGSGSLNMDTSDTQVLILRQTQIVYR